MKNKVVVTTLSIIGLIFGIIGLVLSFLPLGTIDLVPASIGLITGVIIYFLTKKSKVRRKLVLTAIIISSLAILISLFTVLFMENKVAEDIKFEEKMDQSVKEATDELEELEELGELEEVEEVEETEE